MQADTKPHPLNNLSVKIIALVFGYSLWKVMSAAHTVEVSLQAPISFYNNKGLVIDGPESVEVMLASKRTTIGQLARDIAVHIDAQKLSEGTHNFEIHERDLLLPEDVKLLNCFPETIFISAKKV